MSAPKLRLERCTRLPDGEWRMDEESERRLVRSMRVKAGSDVEGLLPEGPILLRLERRGDGFVLVERSTASPEAATREVTLVIALLKADQFDTVLRACGELGISRVIPVACERSVPRIDERAGSKKLERWRRLLEDGTMVSGVARPPVLEPLTSIDALGSLDLPDLRLAAIIAPDASPISTAPRGEPAAVAIGPEGDWTESEVAALIGHGFSPISLGPRTLRASTAAIAALSWLMLS